jgi:hypothetical protein
VVAYEGGDGGGGAKGRAPAAAALGGGLPPAVVAAPIIEFRAWSYLGAVAATTSDDKSSYRRFLEGGGRPAAPAASVGGGRRVVGGARGAAFRRGVESGGHRHQEASGHRQRPTGQALRLTRDRSHFCTTYISDAPGRIFIRQHSDKTDPRHIAQCTLVAADGPSSQETYRSLYGSYYSFRVADCEHSWFEHSTTSELSCHCELTPSTKAADFF